jgi:hypothetical protein
MHLAADEMTTEERCEWLLSAIACAITGKAAHELLPWRRRGLEEFAKEVSRG